MGKIREILVTGAAGFIGSHLTEALIERGHSVRSLIRYTSRNDWGWLEHSVYKDKIKVFRGDIRDYGFVRNSIEGCDTVIHLAALIGIPYSYISPLSYIETNIIGTYNILQSAKECSLDNVIITSTSEAYGTAQYVPIDEKHPKAGQSPYSATKIAADQLATSYYKSFGLPVKIVRPFNTYGPRQSLRAVIPTIITQLLAGNEQILLGQLSPTRDMLFIKDTVNGFIEIAETDDAIGEEINIATKSEISIGDLAQKIIAIINPKAKVLSDEQRIRPQDSEVQRLLGDNKKIKKITNWQLKYNLDAGLKETIDWFRNKNNLKLYKPNIYNV